MPKFLVSTPKFLMTLAVSFCVFFLFIQAPEEKFFIFENTFNYSISVILALLVGFITGRQAALRHILFKADIVAAVLALILVFIVKSLAPLSVLSSDYEKHHFYLPSLFILFALLIGLFIELCKFSAQQKTIKKETSAFPTDEPLEHSTFLTDEPLKQEDSEVDKPDIDCILKKLKGTKTTSQAFAIGITGAWGSGKTSFANSLSRRLNETNSLWFEPWKFRGVANVQDSLFNELIDHFKKNNKYDLAFDTEAYERLLHHDGIPVYLKFLFNFLKLFKNDSEPDIQEKFKKSLGDKKIYIFIDDLDRLDAIEILEVFKLVRSTLSISNLVYILIYDKAHIQSVLEKEVTEGNAKNFLDKIIQTEYHVPSKGLMSDYFIKSFAKNFAENENFSDYEKAVIKVLVNNLENDLTSGTTTGGHSIFTKETYNFKTIFNSHIFTIRDLKRLVNNFLLTSNTIRRNNWQVLFDQNKDLKTKKLETKKYEIYFQFLLEILKAKYPEIYDKLYFQDPNWKILANEITHYNIGAMRIEPNNKLINSCDLHAENAGATPIGEHHKILKNESFKNLFSELFARHLINEARTKLSEDLKKSNGIKDLNGESVNIDGQSFQFKNDPHNMNHQAIDNNQQASVQNISSDGEIQTAASIYRFEKFAKKYGFLCHQDHYEKYFKPSIDAKAQSEAT